MSLPRNFAQSPVNNFLSYEIHNALSVGNPSSCVIAKNGADFAKGALFAGFRDQPPVAVSGRNWLRRSGRTLHQRARGAAVIEATEPATATITTNKEAIRAILNLSILRILYSTNSIESGVTSS